MKNLERDATQQKMGRRDAPANRLAGLWHLVSAFVSGNARRAEAVASERCDDRGAVLRELGITQAELNSFIRGGPEAERLLPAMAKRLGVALETLQPASRYELRQACTLCPSHRRCRRWLAAASDARTDYRTFCWNGELFDAVLDSADAAE